MTRGVYLSGIAAMTGVAACSFSGAATTSVPATSDLYSSGQAVASPSRGGTLPVEIDLQPGVNRTVQFTSVSGTVNAGQFWPQVTPDGATTMIFGTRYTDVTATDGISGILSPDFEFLSGVFLNANTPVGGTEPASLDFNSIGQSFTDLSPLLQQSFYIGDGLTGTAAGQVQTFHVPDGATRLFLGFVDAYNFGWPSGDVPGEYSDDTGSFSVAYTVVPEPSGIALALLAGLGLLGSRRRRAGLA